MRYIYFLLLFLFLPAMAQQAKPSKPDTTQLFTELHHIAKEKVSLIDSLSKIKPNRAKSTKLISHTYKVYYSVPHLDGSTEWWVWHYKIKGTDTIFQRVTKYKEKAP